MLVKIVKGSLTLTIPAGAVNKYTSAGWELESSEETATEHNNFVADNSYEGDSYSESVEEDEDVIYVDPEELAKRPLEELDREELKILAESKGVDVSEINSTKKLRSILRSLE